MYQQAPCPSKQLTEADAKPGPVQAADAEPVWQARSQLGHSPGAGERSEEVGEEVDRGERWDGEIGHPFLGADRGTMLSSIPTLNTRHRSASCVGLRLTCPAAATASETQLPCGFCQQSTVHSPFAMNTPTRKVAPELTLKSRTACA